MSLEQPAAPIGAEITVEFPRGPSPVPAFASFVMVHRLPAYVLIDLGSIDPLSMDNTGGASQRATLQHVGRVAMPDATARRLMNDLALALAAGEAEGAGPIVGQVEGA